MLIQYPNPLCTFSFNPQAALKNEVGQILLIGTRTERDGQSYQTCLNVVYKYGRATDKVFDTKAQPKKYPKAVEAAVGVKFKLKTKRELGEFMFSEESWVKIELEPILKDLERHGTYFLIEKAGENTFLINNGTGVNGWRKGRI